MVQPKNRRFVMEDRLDAELATLNTEIDSKVTGPVDNAEIADGAVTSSKIADGTIVEGDLADGAVTSAKILNGTIVNADVNASAAIAFTKVTRPPLSNASDVSLTTPALGQALTYDGTNWVNATPVNSLSGLSDVTITSPAGGEVVKYNAAISKWVNGAAAGGVTASDTAPALATSSAGDAWFDTNDGTLYVCYVDPDSTKQWVQVQANSALEGSILARLGALESQSIAFGSLSPNYIINGGMDIWQRGTSPTAGTGYRTADRWHIYNSVTGTTTTAQESTIVPSGMSRSLKLTQTVATNVVYIFQSIETEMSRLLAGKTVTVSAYVYGAVSTSFKIGMHFDAAVDKTPVSAFSSSIESDAQSVGANWTRIQVTGTVPVGTNTIRINVQAINPTLSQPFYITGVQLEVGSTATSFRRNQPNIQAELAACQRYYYRRTAETPYAHIGSAFVYGGSNADLYVQFPTVMRTAPTSMDHNITGLSFLGGTLNSITSVTLTGNSNTAIGNVSLNGPTGSAGVSLVRSLNNSATYIGFSAEL